MRSTPPRCSPRPSSGPSADLVLTATESSDGYTGTVPEQIAELLGLPSITFAKEIDVDGETVKVQRQTEAGYDEVTCPLPAVVSVTAGVVEPRYPSFKGIMAAKTQAGRRGDGRRPRPRRRPGRLGRRRPGDRRRRGRARPRGRRDHRGRRRGLRQDRRASSTASRSSERHPDSRRRTHMALEPHLGVRRGRRRQGQPRSPSSCWPRPARSATPSRPSTPAATPTPWPARSAPTAPPRSTPPATSAARCPACPWPRPSPRPSPTATRPTSSCSAPPTTGATSPPACR